jgi:hypothetical protein
MIDITELPVASHSRFAAPCELLLTVVALPRSRRRRCFTAIPSWRWAATRQRSAWCSGRLSGAVNTPEAALQGLLVVSGAYLLGAVFQRAGFALLCTVVVQLCVGGYWPCVGYYRGRLLMHEQRNTVIVISSYVDLCVVRCPAVYVVCVTVPHR